jgi:hypothetical protein
MMTFRFSEDELVTLVEVISISAIVVESVTTLELDSKVASIESLESKIFERILEAGHTEIIEYSDDEDYFQLTEEFQKNAFYEECIAEYRQESFWEELVIRLADRDLIERIGQYSWESMSEEERRVQTKETEKRYWAEVSKNGVAHIRLVHPAAEG